MAVKVDLSRPAGYLSTFKASPFAFDWKSIYI
jgi:hypothetical protein